MNKSKLQITLSLCIFLVLPVCQIRTAQTTLLPNSPSNESTEDDGLFLDPDSVRIIELDNIELLHSKDFTIDPLVIVTAQIDPTKPGSFALYANSFDGNDSVMLIGGVDSFGRRWLRSVQYSRVQAEELLLLMEKNESISFRGYQYGSIQYVSTTNLAVVSGFWDGFWEGYWHYLTNPSEMDDDLEYGFYGAVGTAAVAGTAAGGVYVWGAMGGGQFAVSISAGTSATRFIPHITYGFGTRGVYTWAHGVKVSGFTTTYGATQGGLTITGIPILAPGAVATWVGTRPDVGNCGGSCVIALLRGLWPF